jgi:hypothetical protein
MGGEAGDVTHVELQRQRLAAQSAHLVDHGQGLGFAALVGNDHVAATAGDVQCGVAAQAAAGAGNESNRGHDGDSL